MDESASNILIVDGKSDDRASLRRMLTGRSEHHYIFIEAELGVTGLNLIQNSDSFPFDCVLLNERLKDMDAREFLAALCKPSKLPPCAVVVLSDSDPIAGQNLLRSGAQDCLMKSRLTSKSLTHSVESAIERISMSVEHQQMRKVLRESDARFRALLEAAADAMVIVDQHGIIVLVNALTKRMFGYSYEELIGQHVEMLLPIEMRDSHDECLEPYSIPLRCLEVSGSVELLGLRKDGSQFPIEASLSPLETSQGMLISSAIRDITHRRDVEDRLRKSDAQLRFILDSMPQMIATTTSNGEVDYLNPQYTEFTGLLFEQLRAWGWTQFIHPDDVDEHVRVWKQSIQSGEIFEFESRFRRHDGQYRWHFSRALPMRDSDGKVVMWVGSNTDIHDIKQTESSLQISEVRYRRLFEAAKDGILILDLETGRIVDANPFMSDLLGYRHEDFLDKELWEIGLFKDRSANQAAVRTLQATGYLRYEHLPLESTLGEAVEVEIVANAYREADHEVIQCNIRDITERSRLEKLLQSQATELSSLHHRKDEFLAMLSHELRSPLAPIASAVHLMSLQPETESRAQQQARSIIERQLVKLQHLVDDLLEVSRITSGRIQLRLERVAINGIVQGAVETVRPMLEQRLHELTVALPVDSIWLHADTARLEQVVTNLLTNAAKYTEEGGHVWLTVKEESGECVIRVRDSGTGISPTLLPHVFDLFTQAERTLDRSQGGLGIGLALVRQLTELHGGTVEAISESGEGSEFIVRLPLLPDESPEAASIPDISDAATRGLRVLVVDDNLDTALGYSMLLKAYGHDVRMAHNGLSVFRTAGEFHPHVILLDIGLPGLNGFEVAKQIRERPEGKSIVLIALTGYGQESDRQASANAGFNHHLVKPARFDQLLKILNTVEDQVL